MSSSTSTKPLSKTQALKKIRSEVTNLKSEFLSCRDTGHVWNLYRIKKIRGGFDRGHFCKSCKTNRKQFISNTGQILSTTYDYDTGYQMVGIGRITSDGKAVMRMESLDRTLINGDIDLDPNTL